MTPTRRAVYLLVALAALLPVAVTIALRPAMYNGIRHFVFVLPPLAVLGGLAGAYLLEASRRSRPLAGRSPLALLALGIALPVVDDGAAASLSSTRTSTGSPAASPARSDRYMLDYWGLAFKQASQALLAKLRAARSQARRDAAGRSRSAARTARRRSSSAPISRPPGIRAAPTSP